MNTTNYFVRIIIQQQFILKNRHIFHILKGDDGPSNRFIRNAHKFWHNKKTPRPRLRRRCRSKVRRLLKDMHLARRAVCFQSRYHPLRVSLAPWCLLPASFAHALLVEMHPVYASSRLTRGTRTLRRRYTRAATLFPFLRLWHPGRVDSRSARIEQGSARCVVRSFESREKIKQKKKIYYRRTTTVRVAFFFFFFFFLSFISIV